MCLIPRTLACPDEARQAKGVQSLHRHCMWTYITLHSSKKGMPMPMHGMARQLKCQYLVFKEQNAKSACAKSTKPR